MVRVRSGSRLGFRNGISVRVRFSGPSGGRSGIGLRVRVRVWVRVRVKVRV